jgi:basic amino acid/polyamine antiporter, APA family
MPIGILGSLGICTVIYILVAGVLTGLVKYTSLDTPAPIALGTEVSGVRWGSTLVNLGAICGLSSAMMVTLLGQSRIFFSMSRDGLLPKWASAVHPRFRTPYISTILVGMCVASVASLTSINVMSELVSIGTLLAFVIVCGGVWILRRRGTEVPRAFVAPWIPFTPIMGIAVSLLMMLSLGWETWARLITWLAVGVIVYFSYGRKPAKCRN